MLDVRTNGPVFEVSGSLDADTAPRFPEAVRRTDGDIRVDGSRLQRLDGAGLTALVVARRVRRERGRELVVVSVSPRRCAASAPGARSCTARHHRRTTMADGYEMLSEDHREVERLFDTYRHDPEDSIARDICSRLSVHTRVEEAALYPALRRYVDGGDDLADVAEQEHAAAKSIIARIDGSSPEQLFDLVTELRSEVEHHVESEESDLFPEMRESGVDAGVLGAEIAGARRIAEANTAP
jgi:ABC-type transporter Mla MlaB component/hemerythrin superfamily protein